VTRRNRLFLTVFLQGLIDPAKINVKLERGIDEKGFSEQKRVFKSGSYVYGGYGFVRMLGKFAKFCR
jgi:hypothetical protein